MNWSGKVLLWEEHGLFIGAAGTATLHDSPAIKVCVSLDGGFQLRESEDDPWVDHTAALIPAGQVHAINGLGNRMAMLLLAPEGELGQVLVQTFAGDGNSAIHQDVLGEIQRELNQFSSPDIGFAPGSEIYRTVVKTIASTQPGEEQGTVIDPRVSQGIDWIRTGRERGISVGEIATGVELSESRFSHLFTEHIRVPVRRYLLWLRLRDALHMLAGGGSLTDTAHAAGFADSAHLTRTFRAALGITPSALVKESTLVSFLE
ncbi:MAG: AraC family transcriptional regulator [Pyrinomonadaceae bacterium]